MIVERVESWLVERAFPFWSDVGLDRAGPGFVEHLTLDGRPADVPFKRVRVQARQVYCFCQAAEVGWQPDGIAIAERGIDLLIGKAWSGPDRGWASSLTRAGGPLDTTPDLYDIAFVLFALGWWHRATRDPRVIRLAHETLDFIQTHMRHPSGEGYLHRLNGLAPHLQNPHMHLTEAMIVLRDSTRQARFAEEAEHLVSLCLRRFYDPASGFLAERFSESWSRIAGADELVFEPGHHYEWVWLLDQFTDRDSAMAEPTREAMRTLFASANRHGQSRRTGLVFDSVRADGTVSSADHRLWPQAERLKAWLAMARRDGVDAREAVVHGVDQIFRHYLDTTPAGTWIEYRDPELRPTIDKIPSSSFYHLVLAFADVVRSRALFEAVAV